MRLLLCFVLLLLPVTAQARADDPTGQPPLLIPRLESPIVLDGLSSEPAWDAITPLPLTMYQPTFQGEMTERSEIRVGYDDEALYIAARFYDSDPAGIRANSLYRDAYGGDDVLGIVIDTFNDNQNAFWFYLNPQGTRIDEAVANDAEPVSGPVTNPSWNTFWDAKTVMNGEGWFAEVRIPFSSLRFQVVEGQVTMGLIAYRMIARKNERHIFPAIPPNWGGGFIKPSVMRDVTFQGIRSKRPVYVAPYLVAGVERTPSFDAAQQQFIGNQTTARDIGADLKYSLTNDLTLDLTVNTDFAQVEADDQQVNLSRFSLFFPEKRQFFQERSDLFDFTLGGSDRLFYSRRIGLYQGVPVPIIGGVRLTGRAGAWDVGFMDMQTARDGDLPTENFGVLRLRRPVLNPYSYVGAIATSRLDEHGAHNLAVGVDGSFRVIGDEYLTVNIAQTHDTRVDEGRSPLDNGQFLLRWRRRAARGLYYQVGLAGAGKDFFPAMGFVQRTDFIATSGMLAYGFFPENHPWLRRFAPSVGGYAYFRRGDGSVESANVNLFNNFEFKRGGYLHLIGNLNVEDLPGTLQLTADTAVPAGRYTFFDVSANTYNGHGRRVRLFGSVGGGTYYDGWQAWVSGGFGWNPSPHLSLSGDYNPVRIAFPDRDQGFTAHIARFRAQAALNTQVSATAFLQYSNLAEAVVANVRLRYNIREGNDLWFVYNEGLNTVRERGGLTYPLSNARTVLLKYVHTFQI